MTEGYDLMPPFRRLKRQIGSLVVQPYYSGPFRYFEDCREKDTYWDVAPLVSILPAGRQRILEIGSGTGRIAFELAKRGHNVTALDSSPTVYKELCAKIASHPMPLPIEPLYGDALHLSKVGEFSCILIGSLSINLFKDDDLGQLLSFVKANLLDSGFFCLAVFDEGALRHFETFDGSIDRSLFIEFYCDEEGYDRFVTTCIEFKKDVSTLSQNWFVDLSGTKIYEKPLHIATTLERIWTYQEIMPLMRQHGFEIDASATTKVSGGGANEQVVHMLRFKHLQAKPHG